MTESNDIGNSSGSGQENISSPAPVSSSHAPVDHQSAQTQSEKLLKQSEVNEIVGRAKHEAIERYKRQSEQQSHQSQSQPQGMSETDYRRMAAEEAERLKNQWEQESQKKALEADAHRIANEFYTKLSMGKEKYPDFEKVTSRVNFSKAPHIVQLTNMVDNTADVLYELAKHPTKFSHVSNLVRDEQYDLAYEEMRRLSDSIKENDKATNTQLPNDPLSQLRPTNTGTDSGGAMSVEDYRRRYKG